MDIIINKKSKLLYQEGDKKIKDVIDLRHFSSNKKRNIQTTNNKNVVSEIVRKEIKSEKSFQVKRKVKNQECSCDYNSFTVNNNSDRFIFTEKISKVNFENKNKKDSLISRLGNSFLSKPKLKFSFLFQKSFVSFVLVVSIISLSVFSLSFIQRGIEKTGRILGVSTQAYDQLKLAGKSVSNNDFESGVQQFDSAKFDFANTKKLIEGYALGISGVIGNLPINTPISTAKNLAEAGENISLAGKNITEFLDKISKLDKTNFSAELVFTFRSDINNITKNLDNAKESLDRVDLNYVPEEFRSKINIGRQELFLMVNNFQNLSEDFEVITEMLGKNQQQKYLLLFQNNSEIRATGGFVGSYGILDIENGKIKNLKIDGIFNPDGQLTEKIIPPMPIQKISSAWSMHDANWFADFPTSAKKVALFYEKTGGPTVDGVIAITPEVLKKILEITGPVEMSEYNLFVSKDNFLIQTQLEVEELYDKKKNNPKQILSDLAPKIIEKLLDMENYSFQERGQRYLKIVNVIEESLFQKHIIFYHRNPDIENMIIRRGWGGQISNSSGDYLSVVNSNINGYKTDAVIEEKITHNAQIQVDGSIIDTVRITRKHSGGKSEYNWYNRVNSNYMRVYVPLGSILLEAKGNTIQEYNPPIDYSKFETDPDVKKIEDTIKIDPDSGTYVFQEAGKTVFGNWVYVSPGETVEVVYIYILPYKINFDSFTKPADKYNILVQKQSGSVGSGFTGTIEFPEEWKTVFTSKGLDMKDFNKSMIETDLKVDRIYGVVFERRIKD